MTGSLLASLGAGAAPSSAGPDFGSPIGHWDASLLALSNGATVTTWPDLAAGEGAFVTEFGAPTFVANAQNGLGVVECGGSGQTLQGTWNVALVRPVTIFIAAKEIGSPSVSHLETPLGFFFTNGSLWDMNAGVDLTGGTFDTAFHVFGLLFNGASSQLRIDGAAVATGNSGVTAPSGTAARINGPMRFGEIYVYNGNALALDTETFLRTKWGTA